MAVARMNELRALGKEELSKRLSAYKREMLEGGENPKKGRNLRKAIARIETIMNEEKLKGQSAPKSGAKAPAKKKVKQVA